MIVSSPVQSSADLACSHVKGYCRKYHDDLLSQMGVGDDGMRSWRYATTEDIDRLKEILEEKYGDDLIAEDGWLAEWIVYQAWNGWRMKKRSMFPVLLKGQA